METSNSEGIKNVQENKVLLTFSAFLAASAPDRLSKVTNPTGWKVKNKNKQLELISIKQNCWSMRIIL